MRPEHRQRVHHRPTLCKIKLRWGVHHIRCKCRECLLHILATTTCHPCRRRSIPTPLCRPAGFPTPTPSTSLKLQVEMNKLREFSWILIRKSLFSGAYNYGTYPGAYGQQIQQGGYPHPQQQQPQDPNKPYGF